MTWNPNCTEPAPFKFVDMRTKDRDREPPPKIRVYRNGQATDLGIEVLVQRREYPHWYAFLDSLTDRLRYDKPVERLFTTTGRQVYSIRELERRGEYVATTHGETFKKIGYGEQIPQEWTIPSRRDAKPETPDNLNSKRSLELYMKQRHEHTNRHHRHQHNRKRSPGTDHQSSQASNHHHHNRSHSYQGGDDNGSLPSSLLSPDYLIRRMSLTDVRLRERPGRVSGHSSGSDKSRKSRSSDESHDDSESVSPFSSASQSHGFSNGYNNNNNNNNSLSKSYHNYSSQQNGSSSYKSSRDPDRLSKSTNNYGAPDALPPKPNTRNSRIMSPEKRRKFVQDNNTKLQKAFSVLSMELDDEISRSRANSVIE